MKKEYEKEDEIVSFKKGWWKRGGEPNHTLNLAPNEDTESEYFKWQALPLELWLKVVSYLSKPLPYYRGVSKFWNNTILEVLKPENRNIITEYVMDRVESDINQLPSFSEQAFAEKVKFDSLMFSIGFNRPERVKNREALVEGYLKGPAIAPFYKLYRDYFARRDGYAIRALLTRYPEFIKFLQRADRFIETISVKRNIYSPLSVAVELQNISMINAVFSVYKDCKIVPEVIEIVLISALYTLYPEFGILAMEQLIQLLPDFKDAYSYKESSPSAETFHDKVRTVFECFFISMEYEHLKLLSDKGYPIWAWLLGGISHYRRKSKEIPSNVLKKFEQLVRPDSFDDLERMLVAAVALDDMEYVKKYISLRIKRLNASSEFEGYAKDEDILNRECFPDNNYSSFKDSKSFEYKLLYYALGKGSFSVAHYLLNRVNDVFQDDPFLLNQTYIVFSAIYSKFSKCPELLENFQSFLIKLFNKTKVPDSLGKFYVRYCLTNATPLKPDPVLRYLYDHYLKNSKVNQEQASAYEKRLNYLLLLAVYADDSTLIELLIGHGADVNIRNQDGETLLHIAGRHKRNAALARLSGSVDPTLVDNKGRTFNSLDVTASGLGERLRLDVGRWSSYIKSADSLREKSPLLSKIILYGFFSLYALVFLLRLIVTFSIVTFYTPLALITLALCIIENGLKQLFNFSMQGNTRQAKKVFLQLNLLIVVFPIFLLSTPFLIVYLGLEWTFVKWTTFLNPSNHLHKWFALGYLLNDEIYGTTIYPKSYKISSRHWILTLMLLTGLVLLPLLLSGVLTPTVASLSAHVPFWGTTLMHAVSNSSGYATLIGECMGFLGIMSLGALYHFLVKLKGDIAHRFEWDKPIEPSPHQTVMTVQNHKSPYERVPKKETKEEEEEEEEEYENQYTNGV